jgi:polysaccharide deacetylase family protein (PEP-CTERM system associated)
MRPSAVFSVDVEDYFHVQAFAGSVNREQWSSFPCRVEANTKRVLDLLDRHGVRGTFFILGWVAERYPALVREIVARGHEPACHSYWHRLIFEMTRAEFKEDTHRAKAVIEDAGGCTVRGYRAPSFSVVPRSTWAWVVLAELGFTYDSSVFPIRHDTYGYVQAPRTPFHVRTPSGTICEYPMTTFRIATQNMPVGGGGYLRIFPFWYTRFGVRRSHAEGVPLVAYIHPWEVDPAQPRLRAGLLSRFRHYTNLRRTEELLERLLGLGSFGSFQDCALDSRALDRVFAPDGEPANG